MIPLLPDIIRLRLNACAPGPLLDIWGEVRREGVNCIACGVPMLLGSIPRAAGGPVDWVHEEGCEAERQRIDHAAALWALKHSARADIAALLGEVDRLAADAADWKAEALLLAGGDPPGAWVRRTEGDGREFFWLNTDAGWASVSLDCLRAVDWAAYCGGDLVNGADPDGMIVRSLREAEAALEKLATTEPT